MRLEDAKILISDDSVLARKQLKDTLSRLGASNFIEASDGQKAIDLYKSDQPDLVFLDLVMPVKDGDMAIREIIDYDPEADIIVVSSVGTQSQLMSSIRDGAKDFIQKPFHESQIEQVISSRFEGR